MSVKATARLKSPMLEEDLQMGIGLDQVDWEGVPHLEAE